MNHFARPLAATAAVLALSACPALATASTSPAQGVRARTRLTAKIAAETPHLRVDYWHFGGRPELFAYDFPGDAGDALYAARDVSGIPADSAQSVGKFEWVLGAQELSRGANLAYFGNIEYKRNARGRAAGADAAALSHLRLANFLLGDADTTLGVAHPRYAAIPVAPHTLRMVQSPTPLLSPAPAPTLTGEIAFASPLLSETVLEHVPSTSFGLNEAAAAYAAALVGDLHVTAAAQRATQREWVDGVRDLLAGDEQVVRGCGQIHGRLRGVPVSAAVRRAIAQGFSTLRQAGRLIARADAQLGVHPAQATVTLPGVVRYND